MAYRNGRDALPPELLNQVQQYAAGECLYIPKIIPDHGTKRRRDPALASRNHFIHEAYQAGRTVKELAKDYFLSTQSIYKILKKT